MKSVLIKINIFRKWIMSFSETSSLVTTLFHKKYYSIGEQTTFNTFWLGVKTLKCPLDLWVYQEILWDKQPDVIVECGTKYGGSALYMAGVCDSIGKGRIISVDIEEFPNMPVHERITYIHGSSVSDEVIQNIRGLIKHEDKVMVLLDSNHRRDHVYKEIKRYSPLVTRGQYLIVEDTNINGHPARASYGPGPMEAVRKFMLDTEDFECDRSKEKFLLTYNPKGYLLRKNDK